MTELFHDKEVNQEFILKELQKGNERAFDFVFNEYYTSLIRFSWSFVKDQDKAESLVQEVFLKLWEKRETLVRIDNLFSYLMGMVRNQSIDYLRKEKTSLKAYHMLKLQESVNTTEEQISKNEFEEKLLQSILKLPERCRIAFEMSRFEGCPNKEIAQKMEISMKGVEGLVGRSLKFLRADLKEFLPLNSGKNKKGGNPILFALLLKHFKRQGITAV